MRTELWNALRRIDLARASRVLGEEIQHGEGLDPHLLLACFDVEHLARAPLPLPWRAIAESSPLRSLYIIADRFFLNDWPGALAARTELADMLDEDAAALASGLAIRAARGIGDAAAARAIATQAAGRYPANPFVLYLALCLELESPFLSCPDLLLVDLATRSQSEAGRFYMETSWPAVALAVSAWLYHRDGSRTDAQAEINAFFQVGGANPVDAVLAAPFLAKLLQGQAADLLSRVPPSAPLFLEAHLRLGNLAGARREAILEEAVAMDPSNPFFRLEAILRRLPLQGGEQTLADLDRLLAQVPWYQAGLQAALRVAIAVRDGAAAHRHAQALLEQTSSFAETFTWTVATFEEAGWHDLMADVVAAAMAHSAWQQQGGRGLDQKALGALALGNRTAEITSILNHRAVTAKEEESQAALLAVLLTRDGRLAMEALADPSLLLPEAALLCGQACTFLGLFPLARVFLSPLLQAEIVGDPLRRHAELLVEAGGLAPALRDDTQDVQLLEHWLSMLAGVAAQEPEPSSAVNITALAQAMFANELNAGTLRQLRAGRYHQALSLLRFGVARLPRPEIATVAAEILLEELKDSGTALALLDEYAAVVRQAPDSLRTRCVALEKLDRGQEWLQAARDGRVLFAASPEFIIEEGLAFAALGEMPAALDRIYEGLGQRPDDQRGLERFKALAPRFGAHLRLLSVLEAALERDPEAVATRDAIIELLGTIEDHARDRLLHLYQRVHRGSGPDDEKRAELQEVLIALRRRLLSRPVTPGQELARFARENVERIRAAIAEVQPRVADRILAAVFAEVKRDAKAGEKPRREPAVILVFQTNDLLREEREGMRAGILSMLRSHNFRRHAEIYGMREVWDAVRGADSSVLDLLLAGVPACDFAFLDTLRLAQEHCRLIREECERHLICYTMAGSFVRGTHRIDSDVDVWMVIDDSDLRSMSRAKLLEISEDLADKIRRDLAQPRKLHGQVYTLSSLWMSLQAAEPVIVSLIRDGVPLYDRGFFYAWARLLRDGYLRSTRESLDVQLEVVEDLHTKHVQKMRQLAHDLADPIKYGTVKMLEILLQVLDLPVGHYREVIELATEEIAGRRALLTGDDLELARKAIAYVKAVEAGAVPPLEEALLLFRQVQHFIETTRAIYRRLLAEKDRVDLEELMPRIDATLTRADSLAEDNPWRQKLISFRDAALEALQAAAGSELGAVRVSALVARLPDVALSIKLLEAQH